MTALKVKTETSTYLINTQEKTLVRIPGEIKMPAEDLYTSTLRKDNETIDLVEVLQLEVGESMVLTLDIRKDGILTVRETTEVLSIEELTK